MPTKHDRMLRVSPRGAIAVATLVRPDKRNAINARLLDQIAALAEAPPKSAKVVVLLAEGDHFCAGLDLAELKAQSPVDVMETSRRWHEVFGRIEFGRVPWVAGLKGAVIGGGLELALACHVRVADTTSFYQLPEGQRGIFVGGGASVRASRVLGVDRLAEMMLTARRLDGEEGQRLGLSHYLVPPEQAGTLAMSLARRIADNAPVPNMLMIHALRRIAEMPEAGGYFTEALAAALAQSVPDAQRRIDAFLKRRRR
jgi:(methylthio)acryloyl-CoA hydratase